MLYLLKLTLPQVSNQVVDIPWGVYIPASLALNLIIASLISIRFTRPLIRLVWKAYRIANKRRFASNPSPILRQEREDADNLMKESNEYEELDEAIDRISRKLSKRERQLTKEREEAQFFLGAVTEAIVRVDANESVTAFNSQFASQFLDTDLIQRGSFKLSEVFRIPEVYETFRISLESGLRQRQTVKIKTKLEQQSRYFMLSVNPIFLSGPVESAHGVVGLFSDITDVKKAEQIRIDFVGNASHELRTPLTSIKGYLDTLKEDVATGNLEMASRFLETVTRNVDRLIELVNDLLNLSALDSGAELKLETISPLMITEQVLSELKILTYEKNHTIRFECTIDSFVADAQMVEQVLRNLVANAIKYIPARGIIWIRWEHDGRGAILRVIDNGPGIPEEHHSRLFERFYRVDKGRAREVGGTGLGLAIVKHILQKHGGQIQVKSQMGVGTEFICSFPQLDAMPTLSH